MEHFKDFLIRLQTLDIKVIPAKPATYDYKGKPAYYDLSHESPYLSPAYRNELKKLRELALTDILNLPGEQILFQLKRLEEVKELFYTFWKNYASSQALRGTEPLNAFLYNLDLGKSFIVPRLSDEDQAIASDYFIDDLKDTIRSREQVLLEFEQSVLRIVPVNSEPDNPVVKPLKQQLKAEPVFKELAASDFFDLVKDYFETEDQPLLKELLTSGKEPGTLLLFKDKGNSLADAFKQLFEANLIVGCNKIELIHWIIRNFAFFDKGTPKNYTEKYLQDIISSNTKSCHSPILDVKKRDGQFLIFPTQKNNRNRKL